MDAFTLAELLTKREQTGKPYHEFLRVPAMSVGVYHLVKGSADPQQPHSEDELYYVVQGRAVLQVADKQIPVEPGSIVYVEAHAEHRFHSIEEDLTVLVFFAPAENSQRKKE
ncbi:cupin domain-containing protein [Brevibacillus sp. SYP-B805]|uniref:cupin domain-containing protein n=1 Tax=Brevibacillus sp. SYP-B805 TaxID=1578199 RepID=UPI0013EE14A4|nr:cupin domain-containing protein [Brevibacillus sp. SYP-B805]NGQ96057.1 cupin domain-containing protein [Brevibacillus sp. SYP-B805]